MTILSDMPIVDISQAERMLNILDASGNFTFQTFADRAEDRKRRSLVSTLHGDLSTHSAILQTLNAKGAGVYVTVNATDLKGRKASNIAHVRALFVDFDQSRPERLEQLKALPCLPSMIVESSQGKHHAYWVLGSGEIALTDFTNLQKKLIQYFTYLWGDKDNAQDKEVDQSIHDLPRVLRLAGFIHQKETPCLSQVVHIGDKYPSDDLTNWIESMPVIEQPKSKPNVKKQPVQKVIKDQSLSYSHKEVKLLARGRWVGILEQLGYAISTNPNEHTPCPICGGVDRFRFDDQHGDGSYICSQGDGFTISGDGFSLLADHAQMGSKSALNVVIGALNEMGYLSPFDADQTKIETLESEVQRLSLLSESAYALDRTQTAKQLKIQVTVLDKLVNSERKEIEQKAKGIAMFADVQLWDESVNGAELLDNIIAVINRHIVCEEDTAISNMAKYAKF